ncbi:hypothetical protein HRS9139_09274 [Pyrenophora teres f. teres]|nr:hypothetical protein HRS9139_09274 [Pyrenophora teres f. teres]
MSRRPNPAADRAEQNRATLKNLVKLEGNKTCSDCKRNKHPRWASWNLGVFICIRCSGIHRGMGTHISKVKSVDLDTWTDEQLQSVLKWGNARANKYWESKLAPGHVPSEAKIENFIRTKYESKRWVMDGPMPDPSSLEADDDDVPLKKVQEKVQIERSASQRLAQSSSQPPRQAQPQPAIDLFGDDPVPQRPSTGPPVAARGPPKAETAPPKQHKAGDSLLGLDFLGGGSSAAPPRPSSTGPAAAAPSRPDLKQSILSLLVWWNGLSTSTDVPSAVVHEIATRDIFVQHVWGGGNFFDSKPAAPSQSQRTMSPSTGLGDFGSFSSPAPSKPAASSMSGMNDLLDLSMPSAPATSPPVNNAFNLSSPAPAPASKAAPAPAAVNYSGVSNMDAWGGNDVWSSPAPSQPATNATASRTQAPTSSWGAPAVAQDDDFGGWSSAAPTQTTTTHTTTTQSKPAGGFGGASDDLFSNVWE